MPTPIKYYNRQMQNVFHEIEDDASEALLAMLPEDIREDYRSLFFRAEGEEELWRIVKAADKLSALIKCIEESKAGNREFDSAKKTLEDSVHALQVPEAELFMKEFLPAYYRTLDELSSENDRTI
jgi:5'-deoxynucleotidase